MLWHRSSQNKNFSETNIAFFGTAAKIKTASFDQKIIFQISPRFDAGIDFFTSTGVSNSLWMCLQYPSQNPPHSINTSWNAEAHGAAKEAESEPNQ